MDTRSLGFYLGAVKQSHVRKEGHIPGANVFSNELLTTAGSVVYFTVTEDIQQMADEPCINAKASIFTCCNSGQFASAS